MVNVEMFDVVGWQLPDVFLTEVEMEDDETSTRVSYHCIKDTELHDFVIEWLNGKPIDEKIQKSGTKWQDEIKEIMYSIDIEVQATGAPPLTVNSKVKELCSWLVEEVQSQIESAAQEQFESKNGGSYWDGEY